MAASSSNPLSGLENTVGKEMLRKIQTSKLLVVGSGGIGCELLKDLALSGFRHVQVIDLDTIDVSNLNRQLLFRSQHVGMAKCTVACQVASEMVPVSSEDDDDLPNIVYQAHHGNVCDTSKFNVAFVKEFDLVLNALDNVEARRRVNRLCLAAEVSLVEAGTTGYLGQVTVIHKPSDVACYECKTQETQKVYPICTIRSTPSMPVHTIVWAKELYKLVAHSKVEESMLYEDPDGEEPSTYMESVTKLRELLQSATPVPNEDVQTAIGALLKGLYITEIQKQLDMGRYKAAKKTPTVLDDTILQEGLKDTSDCSSTTDIWSLSQCVSQTVQCLHQMATAAEQQQVVLEEFDKDDDLSMRFVTATSNLRSHVFGIEPLQSYYTAKGIAGNIIPAIATTNAICAGLQILQAFSILKAQLEFKESQQQPNLKESCYYINCIRNKTRNGLYLTASKLEDPNPNCFVCKNATIPLTLNINEWTLERFLEAIVKKKLGFEHPTVMLQGDFIWEEGPGADSQEFLPNLPKYLDKLPCGGIQHGTVVELDDASQNLTIQVSVTHKEDWENDEEGQPQEFPFVVGALPPLKKAAPPATAAATPEPAAPGAAAESNDGDDDVVLVLDDDGADNDKKHAAEKREVEPMINGVEPAAKKQKLDESSSKIQEVVIEID